MWYDQDHAAVLYMTGVASSVTGTLTQTTLNSFTLKGNTMGPNDHLEIWSTWSNNSNGNNKTLAVTAGATTLMSYTHTTNISACRPIHWFNSNSLSAQTLFLTSSTVGLGNLTTSPTTAVNTALDITIAFKGTLANTGDTVTLEGAIVRLMRGVV